MSPLQAWINTVLAAVGPVVILLQLFRSAAAALRAANRAEEAALLAASHAEDASKVAATLAVDMKELAVNTNSIKDALVATTGELGRMTGRAEVVAENAAKGGA